VAEEDIERPVDVVRASWDALATGGLDAMAAHWHPDIEWRAVEGAVDDVGVFRGRERMQRYYANWLALFDEQESNVESVLCEEGDVAAVIIVTRARPRGTYAWACWRSAVVSTARDGLVVRGREYPSADAARAAAAALAGY
jgi:ketosteroid isomerase-like protein